MKCSCGIIFDPNSHNHIYCSSKCRRRERTSRYRARKKGVSLDPLGDARKRAAKALIEKADSIILKKINVLPSAKKTGYEFTCGCSYIEGEYCCPECGAIRRRL